MLYPRGITADFETHHRGITVAFDPHRRGITFLSITAVSPHHFLNLLPFPQVLPR